MIAYIILLNAVAVWFIIRQEAQTEEGIGFLRNDLGRPLWRIDRTGRAVLSEAQRRRVNHYLLYYLFAFLILWNGNVSIALVVFLLLLPLILQTVAKIKEERDVESGIVGFLGCLNARLMVDNDIVTALENTQKIVSTKGIRRILSEFSVALKISCNPNLAFEKMRGIHNSYLRYVFINLQNVLDSWGDATELVRELENEYISAQIEINKGRVELQNDKFMTYLGLGLTAMTALNIVGNDAAMMNFYAERPWLAAFLVGLAFSGVVVLFTTKLS